VNLLIEGEEVQMTRRSRCSLLVLALGITLVGCAPKRPVLYPNAHLQTVGPVVAERDIDECVAAADAYGTSTSFAERTATGTATSAATGAAVGAASGAVWGRAGRGAATGAAGGAAAGFMRGLFRWRDPDSIEKGYVNLCLNESGYRTMGWR
jgi:hypothetical protein